MPYQSSKAAVNAITVEFAILNNFLPEHVRRDGKKGFVMERQQIMDQVLTIQQMAQISGLSAHTLRYYECAGLLPQLIGHNEANEYRYHTQKKLLALSIHF